MLKTKTILTEGWAHAALAGAFSRVPGPEVLIEDHGGNVYPLLPALPEAELDWQHYRIVVVKGGDPLFSQYGWAPPGLEENCDGVRFVMNGREQRLTKWLLTGSDILVKVAFGLAPVPNTAVSEPPSDKGKPGPDVPF